MKKDFSNQIFPVFTIRLQVLIGLLNKAREYCVSQNIEESELLSSQLAPDMYDLLKQVESVCDLLVRGPYRLLGGEIPEIDSGSKTIDDLLDRAEQVRALLDTIDRDSLEVDGGCEFTVPTGVGIKLKFANAAAYFEQFILPNLYFHSATVYNLLRAAGVEIGKRDFIGPIEAEIIS